MKPNPLVALADDRDGVEDTDTTNGDTTNGDTTNGDTANGDTTNGDTTNGDTSNDTDSDGAPIPDLPASSCGESLSLDAGCIECLALTCCELAQACADDPDCACLLACFDAGGSPGNCKNECGAKAGDVPTLGSLQACMQDDCAGSC